MSQPNVTLNELDGALGAIPGTKMFAIAGPCSSGPFNLPAAFARTKDIVAIYGAGPAVELACYFIDRFQKPVLFVRTNTTTAGLPGTPDITHVLGTSVPTLGSVPNDDYEILFKVITGGTIAAAGITFQYSFDNGRTLSPVTALGTAATFVFPGAGGLHIDFGTGTLLAGDYVTSRTVAPAPNASDLGLMLDALKNTAQSWEQLLVTSPIDAAAFDEMELKLAGLSAIGKDVSWMGNCRMPSVGESEATYLAAMNTIFSTKASVYGTVAFGAVKLQSSVSGFVYKRPAIFPAGAFQGSVSEEVNIANINLGSLVAVSIRDVNGNPDEHDESIFPGADDARFLVLRTWDGEQGVYVNRPRIFSASGSDFQLIPHRRVMNLAKGALRAYLRRRCNVEILVDRNTGFILEEEALEIESGAMAILRAALLAKPKASGVSFALSRTDNLLTTKTMTGVAGIIPLAYPEFLNFDVGFTNPALLVKGV